MSESRDGLANELKIAVTLLISLHRLVAGVQLAVSFCCIATRIGDTMFSWLSNLDDRRICGAYR